MQRKAQGGLNAAILVAIIAALIILYIVFLPTSQKELFLENKTTRTSTGQTVSSELLRVFPGSLSANKGLEDQKRIPDAFLVETTNAKELKKINPFIVRNGLFDKKTHKINFDLKDPENTDNAVLSFTAKKRKGILTIRLNGDIIFENELESDIIDPVSLDDLRKSNTLEFSVSSVGAQFWTTNEYSFENVKIIGDITDTSRQESTNIFVLSDSEFSNTNKATLQFIPFCGNVNELGTLDIFVNNRNLFSSVPVCENVYKQSIPKSVLSEGENNIVFKTSKGKYSVEQIRVLLEFKEATTKTYFFEIDSTTFSNIRNGNSDVKLSIKFVDNNRRKRAKLDVNGHFESIDTNDASFSKNINSRISQGNNFVRLEPLEDIEVVELKVEMV